MLSQSCSELKYELSKFHIPVRPVYHFIFGPVALLLRENLIFKQKFGAALPTPAHPFEHTHREIGLQT